MSRLETVKGVLRTFWRMSREDFDVMDHKLARIAIGIISFLVMTLIWFYLFRSISPFKF